MSQTRTATYAIKNGYQVIRFLSFMIPIVSVYKSLPFRRISFDRNMKFCKVGDALRRIIQHIQKDDNLRIQSSKFFSYN